MTVDLAFTAVKLFEDEWGVRHWRYPMLGVLLVCGEDTGLPKRGHDLPDNEAPTCIRCIAIMIREEYS